MNFKRFILLFFELHVLLHQISVCNFLAVSLKFSLIQGHDIIERYQSLDFAIFYLKVHLYRYNIITEINVLTTRATWILKIHVFTFHLIIKFACREKIILPGDLLNQGKYLAW